MTERRVTFIDDGNIDRGNQDVNQFVYENRYVRTIKRTVKKSH